MNKVALGRLAEALVKGRVSFHFFYFGYVFCLHVVVGILCMHDLYTDSSHTSTIFLSFCARKNDFSVIICFSHFVIKCG